MDDYRKRQALSRATLASIKLPKRELNAAIMPTDEDWMIVEREFQKLLRSPDATVLAVLQEFFEDWDRELFIPEVNCHTMAEVQRRQTQLYEGVSWRFEGHPITLATKFTMLWFGLPVEPVMAGMFEPYRKLVEDPDDQGLEEIEVRPPLHFLTAHDQRNFGRDSRRGREAPFSTVPVPISSLNGTVTASEPSLRLRGGDLDEASEGVDGDDDDDDDDDLWGGTSPPESRRDSATPEPEDVTMSGGAPGLSPPATEGDDDIAINIYMAGVQGAGGVQKEKPSAPKKNPIPQNLIIRGYQGRAELTVPAKSTILETFRALLSLGPKKTSDIVLHHTDRYGPRILHTETFPVEETALDEAAAHIATNSTTDSAWFINRVGEQPPKVLVPGMDEVLTLSVNEPHGLYRQAYVRFPSYERFFASIVPLYGHNDYMPFFQVAQDVLFNRPQIFRGATNGMLRYVEYPPWQHPNEFGELDTPEAPLETQAPITNWNAWYGGLDIEGELFRRSHPGTGMASESVKSDVHVAREILPEKHAVFLIPGFKDQSSSIMKSPGLSHEAGSLLRELYPVAFPKLDVDYFWIYHGTSFFDPDLDLLSESRFKWDPNLTSEDAVLGAQLKLDQFIRRSLGYAANRGKYFVLQPVYRSKIEGNVRKMQCHLVEIATKKKGPFAEDMHSLERFRKLVQKIHREPIDWKKSCVVLRDSATDDNKWTYRPFVVGPRTTSDEFTIIRRCLVKKEISFAVEDCSAEIDFVLSLASTSQTEFGPRYGPILALRRYMNLAELPDPNSVMMRELCDRHQARQKKEAEKDDENLSRSLDDHGIKPRSQRRILGEATEKALPSGLFSLPPKGPKKNLREDSWSRPLSIYENGRYDPSIPINGPPVEKILRAGKNTNVPKVSMSVLTPTEQTALQNQVHELRNWTLNRIQYCQYDGCDFTYRTDNKKALREHLDKHLMSRCPWCPDVLFQHQDEHSREKHFKKRHAEQIQRLADEIADAAVLNHPLNDPFVRSGGERPPKSRTVPDPRDKLTALYAKLHPRPEAVVTALDAPARAHKFEQEYSYCDRCGRDHKFLDDEFDRDVHDRLCVPHAEGAGAYGFCESCGDHSWNTEEDRNIWESTAPFPHKCRGFTHPGKPFCAKCGLSLARHSDEYIDKHRKMCAGFSSEVASYCPYCQEPLIEYPGEEDDHDEWISNKRFHITACRKRTIDEKDRVVPGDMTPFDLYERGYWAEITPPHDDLYHGPRPDLCKWESQTFKPTRTLTNNLAWHDKNGPNMVQDPPDVCPHEECYYPVFGLRPAEVLEHFEQYHGGLQEKCPFCELSFKVPMDMRKDRNVQFEREYQVMHLECHVFQLWHAVQNSGHRQKASQNTPVRPGHPLYEPFDEGMAPHLKRCPYFEDCGSVVGYMTPRQWMKHFEKMHDGSRKSFFPRQSLNWKMWDRTMRDQRRQRKEQMRKEQEKAKEGTNLSSEDPPSSTTEPDQHPEATLQVPSRVVVTAHSPHSETTQRGQTSLQPPQPRKSTKSVIPPAQPGTSNKPPSKPVNPLQPAHPPACDTSAEENISQTPISALKVPADLFVPKGDYYCSRCLRKAPLSVKTKSDPPLKEQITAHILPSRSCKIKNGVGSAYDDEGNLNLPNQSGWIAKNDMPKGFSFSKEGKAWVRNHRAYRNTIYPSQGGKGTVSTWKYDPNHDKNRAAWSLSFPVPGDKEDDEYGDESMENTSFFNTEGEDEGDGEGGGETDIASHTMGSSTGGAPWRDDVDAALDTLLKGLGGSLKKGTGGTGVEDSSSDESIPNVPLGGTTGQTEQPLFFYDLEGSRSRPPPKSSSTSDSDREAPITEDEVSELGVSDSNRSSRSRRKRNRDGTYKPTKADLAQEKKDYQDDDDIEDSVSGKDEESAKRKKTEKEEEEKVEKEKKRKKNKKRGKKRQTREEDTVRVGGK